MTELYIDKQSVTLPANLNLKVKYQNPFFTKNGAFTLDLTLSLKDETNAKLYRHIDRWHSNPAIESRPALLLVDNHVLLNGTEVILKNTDTEVSIQLVSGNSELNYFIKENGDISDLYISDLDLGAEATLTSDYLNSILAAKYPAAGFAPARIWTGDIVLNECLNFHYATENTPYTFTNIAIQPYLMTLLVRTIQALGYAITENELLADDAVCRLYLLNDIRSPLYNKMLPGWTVKEFLEACERFLNVTFDINAFDKSVRIVKNATGITIQGTTYIDGAFDAYERTIIQDEDSSLDYENVKYPLSEDDWYKYQAVDGEIMSLADISSYDTYAALLIFLQVDGEGKIPASVATNYYKTLKVFYAADYATYFIVSHVAYTRGPYDDSWYYLRPIDRFDSLQVESEDKNVLELPFAPAQMTNISFMVLSNAQIYHNPMPAFEGYSSDEEPADEITDITELIEDGIPDADTMKKDVFLAFYTGSLPGYSRTESAVDYLRELPFCFGKYNSLNLYTLRLNGPGAWAEKYYQANSAYDFTKEYTIRFTHKNMPDVRAEFVINNKRFVCKELEYVITHNGLHPEITGTFYAVK
jgi:hypothetical protein